MTSGVLLLSVPIGWLTHEILYPGDLGRARAIGTMAITMGIVGGIWTMGLLARSSATKNWTPILGLIIGTLLFVGMAWPVIFLVDFCPWNPAITMILISAALIALGFCRELKKETFQTAAGDVTNRAAPTK
jgi:hypothetical protein